jgi:alanyl aminopeptidase
VGDLEALVSAGDVAPGDALELLPLAARDSDRHVVSASARLVRSLVGLVPDAELERFEALVREAYGDRARALGWVVRPGDSEEVRLLRRSLLQVTAGEGRDPQLGREAVALVGRWLENPSVLDPELVVTAVGAASASGDRQLVDRLKQALVATSDRERRERLLDGLGGVREPALAAELLPLTLDDRVDPRESIFILFRLSQHRETRRTAFDFLKANYDALVARSPQGELSVVQYLPWVGAGLCADDTHAEIEAFFGKRAASVAGAPRVLAQVLESVDQCVARKRTQQPALVAYLESRPTR